MSEHVFTPSSRTAVLPRSGPGPFSRTLRAELQRAVQGRQLASLAIGAVVLCLITSYALAAQAQAGTSTQTAALLTEGQVRSWMMTFLLAGIFGSMLFTRDVRTGALTRSVLTSSRGLVFGAKVVVSAVAGLGFGALAAVMAWGTTYGIDTALGVPFAWTTEATEIVLGIVVCCVLAAVFGFFVGVVVRSGTVALLVLLLQTLLVDPGLQRIWPDVAKYLFTIALSSVYRDVLPDILPLAAGAAVAVAWVVVLGAVAWTRFNRKDVTTR
jgi:ABC-2 type transport system permease protein